MSARFFLLIVVLLGAADAGVARAEEAQPESASSFNEGVQRLEAKDYGAAASAFERSLAIKESAPALFNLAVAYRGAGRLVDAKVKLERFIALLESTNASAEALDRARAMLEDLSKKLAVVPKAIVIEPVIARPPEAAALDTDAGSIVSRWWFWAGVVTVVAAGTATGFALSSRRPAEDCGTLDACF